MSSCLFMKIVWYLDLFHSGNIRVGDELLTSFGSFYHTDQWWLFYIQVVVKPYFHHYLNDGQGTVPTKKQILCLNEGVIQLILRATKEKGVLGDCEVTQEVHTQIIPLNGCLLALFFCSALTEALLVLLQGFSNFYLKGVSERWKKLLQVLMCLRNCFWYAIITVLCSASCPYLFCHIDS